MTTPDDQPAQEIDWEQVANWVRARRRGQPGRSTSTPLGTQTYPKVPPPSPPSSPAPGPGGQGSSGVTAHPMPAAPASRANAPRSVLHQGLAAVDFGTSTSTVTLFDSGTHADVALSTEQRRELGHRLADLMEHGLGGPAGVDREWDAVVADIAVHVLTNERWRSPGAASEAVSTSRLVERMQSESASSTSGLADHVLLEFERSLPPRSEELRLAADYALHRVIDAALREPPLSALRLFRVTLDPGAGEDEIPSVVYYSAGDGSSTMLAPAVSPDAARHLAAYRGLKQRLGMPASAPGDDVSVEELIGGALEFLVTRANDYLQDQRSAHRFTAGNLQRIVITYPTMAPPVVRATLRRLVTDLDIPRVVDRYDEAVAASMFLLMREFGGSFDPAVEAFAARSRPIMGMGETRPRHWKHTMLIVDIGGGTIDIALLRLDLFDETPVTPGSGSPQRGRFYRLVPRVLGTTGEAQRGGEYITLLIFRWIKALITDRLLVTRPAEFDRELQQLRDVFRDGPGYRAGSLTRDVLGGDPGARDTALADVNRVVPTRWAAPGLDGPATESARQLFQLIWDLADDAKKALSDSGQDYTLPQVRIDPIIAQIRRRRRPGQVTSLLPGESPAESPGPQPAAADGDWAAGFPGLLQYETFRRLVEPVVREQVELARDLVMLLPELDRAADAADLAEPQESPADGEPPGDLRPAAEAAAPGGAGGPAEPDDAAETAAPAPGDDPDTEAGPPVPRLDRVVLTGRGSRLPTVREQLIEALGEVARNRDGAVRVEWDPGNLSQEVEFAKHATSIGAAWAESINEATALTPSERSLGAGAVLLTFDVDQLLSFMRGTFQVDAARGSGRTALEPLFRTGTPFRLEGSELLLRSGEWLSMLPMVTVNRQRRGDDPGFAWCGFSLDSYQRATGDPYGGDLDGLQRSLFFQVEATPELDMRILLCKSADPLYVRSASATDISEHVRGWFPGDGGAAGEYPDAEIVVNPGIPGSTTGTADPVVFSRSAVRRGAAASFVTRPPGEAGERRLLGVLSSLPPPASNGWRFYLRDPGQQEQEMLQLAHITLADVGASRTAHQLRERAGTPPSYTAALDETGHLAVYSGRPPFRLAGGLTELEEVPGSVLIAEMPSAQADYYSPDDPFSGQH